MKIADIKFNEADRLSLETRYLQLLTQARKAFPNVRVANECLVAALTIKRWLVADMESKNFKRYKYNENK